MPFGFLCYKTENIGDDIQTIAAKQFLPKKSHAFDRDHIIATEEGKKHIVLINGWLMHERYKRFQFPYPPEIKPIFISIHIDSKFRDAFTPDIIEYFQKHQPIGCRDASTVDFLISHDIDAYFTGCLTMTLNSVFTDPVLERKGVILVDAQGKIPDVISKEAKTITHIIPAEKISLSYTNRFHYASQLLQQYRSASLIITSRLHCAIPAISFGTPVVMMHRQPDDPRFGALDGMIHVHSLDEEINWEPVAINIQDKIDNIKNKVIGAINQAVQIPAS